MPWQRRHGTRFSSTEEETGRHTRQGYYAAEDGSGRFSNQRDQSRRRHLRGEADDSDDKAYQYRRDDRSGYGSSKEDELDWHVSS